MTKTRIILFAAEILAVAILRLTFMLRRDGAMPKGSKVGRIKGLPVMNALWARGKRQDKPPPKTFSVGGWTPPPSRRKISDTPDASPDA